MGTFVDEISAERLSSARSIASVVHKGLHQDTLSGIRIILEAIARESSAFGCVLWEVSSTFSYQEGIGSLYPLAQWFGIKDVWREHSVPIRSATGHTLHFGKRLNIPDIESEPYRSIIYRSPYVINHGIARVLLIPLDLRDGARGCLNLYRTREAEPFGDLESDQACLLANLLPDLYETIRDEVAYRLTKEVNGRLQDARLDFSSLDAYRTSVGELGHNLCKAIQKNLHALDVSMFLALQEDSQAFELVGTTLPESEKANLPESPAALRRDPIAGVLLGESIRIPDLGRRDSSPNNEDSYVTYLEHLLAEKRPDAPLSYVAAPIVAAGRSPFGAIRCCAPVDGPLYFAMREQQLLTVLAGQIGQFFSDLRHRWKLTGQNTAWVAVSAALESLATPVAPEKGDAAAVIVRSAVQAIQRALGPSTRVTAKITPVADMPAGLFTTAGERGANFESASAAIGSHTDRVGSLTIDYPADLVLASNIQRIVTLFGLQVGHSYNLARLGEQHKRALMSFQHQIRAPLRHAVRRFPLASRAARNLNEPTLHKQLQFLSGISRRAYRIAMTMQFFSRLESGLPIELVQEEYSFNDILKFLIEAVMDNNAISDPSRGLRFVVNGSSFDQLPKGAIRTDKNLLDQAINDLLDNAAKYSFEGTEVTVDARVTKSFFVLTVSNIGLRIGPDQIADVVKKGVRGALASHQVGEGNGLGLWIVDSIMKAHQGKLEVSPTTALDVTQVRLLFPLARSK